MFGRFGVVGDTGSSGSLNDPSYKRDRGTDRCPVVSGDGPKLDPVPPLGSSSFGSGDPEEPLPPRVEGSSASERQEDGEVPT